MSKIIEALIEQSEATLNKLEARHVKQLVSILDAAFNRLEKKFLEVFEVDINEGSLQKTLRLKQMLRELDAFLTLLSPSDLKDYSKRLEELLISASEIGLKLGEDLTATLDPNRALINAGIDLEAIALTVKNSEDRLRNHTNDFKQRAISIIGYNLSIGSSSRKTARLLQESLGLTKKRSVDIARTETIAALNDSSDSFYERNGLEYVQLFATADDRLCKYCAARNQSIYKRGEISVPLHVRCRCYLCGIDTQWLTDDTLDKDFMKDFYEDGKREITNIDRGLAPFEKSNGRKTPPKPVRTPY